MKPTREQIDAEITALKEIKPRVRHHSAFGDDNHELIDVQVRVLERNMSEDAIWEHWDGPNDDEMLCIAQEARGWLDGEHEDGSLVEGWQPLAR